MALEPFVQTTTPVIERANRLLAVRAHPGYLDILRIAHEISESATAVLVDYPGWDKDQIAVLKARAQAAKEGYEMLVAKINDAIKDGVEEARAAVNAGVIEASSNEQAVETGDLVRQKVLQKFEEMDTRIPGSF
jgi:hypothetical protein